MAEGHRDLPVMETPPVGRVTPACLVRAYWITYFKPVALTICKLHPDKANKIPVPSSIQCAGSGDGCGRSESSRRTEGCGRFPRKDSGKKALGEQEGVGDRGACELKCGGHRATAGDGRKRSEGAGLRGDGDDGPRASPMGSQGHGVTWGGTRGHSEAGRLAREPAAAVERSGGRSSPSARFSSGLTLDPGPPGPTDL